tara:strand:- start:144 stop:566 length:423 start_codon:yes stop_codon:yes gene_type:complete
MLMGCQLIGGQLECVPGMDHLKPQQQINVLKQQIDTTSQRASALKTAIQSLGELELAGEAIAGDLIEARWLAANPGGPQPTLIHWYRQGESGWLLIPEAVGSSYIAQPSDVGLELMAVAIVITPEGHRRLASAPLGPVRP